MVKYHQNSGVVESIIKTKAWFVLLVFWGGWQGGIERLGDEP